MTISRQQDGAAKSANKPAYQTSFVRRSHEILKLGYNRLDAPSFSAHQEEDITGELTRAMQNALEDRAAPSWAKNFWVAEEIRVPDPARLGKRRRRIDIEVIQHLAGPRPRFRFEAKRIHNPASRNDYLTEEGLGCFLDGRYAADNEIAGMLGYIQADSVATHSAALATALSSDPSKYCVCPGGQWTESEIVAGLATFRSTHERTPPLPPITLLHSLLRFC